MSRPARKSSGLVVPHQPVWQQKLVGALVYYSLKSVALTMRWKWTDRGGHFDKRPIGPAIYAIWHNRLALSLNAYYGFARNLTTSAGMAVMVSASKDGAFLSAILKKFGAEPARGSTSRRGPQALRELTGFARRDFDIGITPDGPRGPACKVQEGVIALAQLTGLPILPISYVLGWKWRLKTWDRFQIPLPFSRCEFICGKPIFVPRECTDAEREQFRLQLEESLNRISADS